MNRVSRPSFPKMMTVSPDAFPNYQLLEQTPIPQTTAQIEPGVSQVMKEAVPAMAAKGRPGVVELGAMINDARAVGQDAVQMLRPNSSQTRWKTRMSVSGLNM